MLELYNGVTFETLLGAINNKQLKKLKANLEEILNTKVQCNINNYYSQLDGYKDGDFVLKFNTYNGSYDFPEESIEKCKKLFPSQVICTISKGIEGVKNDYEWKNPFDEETTKQLLSLGMSKKDLELSSIQSFINKYGIENIKKGYVICDSYEVEDGNFIYNTKIIGRIKINEKFKTSIEARIAAEKDGIKFINDIPHLPKNVYIDTKENREIINKEILKNDSFYWTIDEILHSFDLEEKDLKLEDTTRYQYEKIFGKVDHCVWLYLDKNKYNSLEQTFLEENYDVYNELFRHFYIDEDKKELFYNMLNKNTLGYELIKIFV